jgi:hypothetical protein
MVSVGLDQANLECTFLSDLDAPVSVHPVVYSPCKWHQMERAPVNEGELTVPPVVQEDVISGCCSQCHCHRLGSLTHQDIEFREIVRHSGVGRNVGKYAGKYQ